MEKLLIYLPPEAFERVILENAVLTESGQNTEGLTYGEVYNW